MNGSPRLLTQSCDARSMDCRADRAEWLSPAEQEEFARLRDARRRREWLAGRWLLKGVIQDDLLAGTSEQARRVAVAGPKGSHGFATSGVSLRSNPGHPETSIRGADHLPFELSDIEILSRDALGRGRPPRVVVAGRLLPWHVSLAHHGGIVWAAVSTDPDVRVGIDVVPAQPMDLRADDLWFTRSELWWLRQSNDRLLGATLWGVKEAVYKATNRGETFVPARIEVAPGAAGGFTWSRDGISCGCNDSISVARLNRTIVVAVSVGRETRND